LLDKAVLSISNEIEEPVFKKKAFVCMKQKQENCQLYLIIHCT